MKQYLPVLLAILFLSIRCNSTATVEKSETKPIWKECAGPKYGSEFCTYIRLTSHINREFKYPPFAKENDIKGEISVEFYINKLGVVEDINLLNNLGFGCDKEVVRVLRTIPDFIPATQNGEHILSKDTLIFNFSGRGSPIESVYKAANVPPSFGNCQSNLSTPELNHCTREEAQHFFLSHFKYPKQAKRKKIQGNVLIRFVVEKDGSISYSHIVRDLDYGCGKEALRIVKMMPKWVPAKERGKNVRHSYTLSFKLEL